MSKLLVNSPPGVQRIVEVSATGNYFDPARVLWDESKDGAIPDGIALGGMVRQGASLVFDQLVKDAHDAALALTNAENERITALDDEIATDTVLHAIKAKSNAEIDTWMDNNVTDLQSARNLLKRIVKVLIRRVL